MTLAFAGKLDGIQDGAQVNVATNLVRASLAGHVDGVAPTLNYDFSYQTYRRYVAAEGMQDFSPLSSAVTFTRS